MKKIENYISRVLLGYVFVSSIIPLFALLMFTIFWILNVLDPNASYWGFLQLYYYSGELLPGMHAWRIHIVLGLVIAFLSLPIFGSNDDFYDNNF